MISEPRHGRRRRGRLLPMLIVGNGIIGGMEEYVLSLVRHFRERRQRALVAAPFIGEFTAALLEQGHPARDMYLFDMSDHINVGALAQLSTFLQARKVSLVHTHLLPADTLGAAAAAHAGVPALSTLHGVWRCKEELLLRDLYGLEYVAVSEAGRASAIANGLPPEAVRKIPNGVDPRRFDPRKFDREALRRRLGIQRGEVLVTSVSRLAREKYPEGFLKVAELAAASDPRLVFALVGAGPLEFELQQMAAASAARGRIRLLGARRDIPEILAASDIAALCSRSESLPFSMLEAMSMELPVVSHDVGGVGEALDDGSEGFLIPFGRLARFAARISTLAADPALRLRMGLAGRKKVLQQFDFGRTATDLLDLYAALVQRHGTSSERAVKPLTLGATAGGDGEPARSDPPPSRSVRSPRRIQPREFQPALDFPVVDSHLHLSGGESCRQVLETLEAAGVAHACLIAPFLDASTWVPASGAALWKANDVLVDLVSQAPDRLWGLIGVDPLRNDAVHRVAAYASIDGVGGVKMIPHGWRPDDPAAMNIYEVCAALGLPILFHSGIFISGRCSNDCRPALYEVVRRFPPLRVVLAHVGWPWTDEAIAVAFMDLLRGAAPQISLDISPGTPPVYRRQALRRAYEVLGSSLLLFGSDRFLPTAPAAIADRVAKDARIFRGLRADAEDLRRIFNRNAGEIFCRVERGLTTEASSEPVAGQATAAPV